VSDTITLTGIEGYGYHGVLPEERQNGQPFVVDVEVTIDVAAAAASDDLAATVDYSGLAQQVLSVIEGEPLNLIETAASRIAELVLDHPGVERAAVTVHKPQAPVGVRLADVSVRIEREHRS
jgi:dihydroneopterin aldolase